MNSKLPKDYKTLIEKLLSELKNKLNDNLTSVILYGSVARGDFNKNSDIDLLIICKNLPKERLRRQELFSSIEKNIEDEYEKLYKKEINSLIIPILKTEEEAKSISPLYLDMVEDAIILYDRNDFFEKILNKLKKKLKEINAKKIFIGKKWYWDLMPNYKQGDVISIE